MLVKVSVNGNILAFPPPEVIEQIEDCYENDFDNYFEEGFFLPPKVVKQGWEAMREEIKVDLAADLWLTSKLQNVTDSTFDMLRIQHFETLVAILMWWW